MHLITKLTAFFIIAIAMTVSACSRQETAKIVHDTISNAIRANCARANNCDIHCAPGTKPDSITRQCVTTGER